MSFSYLNNLNSNTQLYQNQNFGARTAPAKNENMSTLDKISQKVEEEKKKKHNRTAMAVGGTVAGLSLLVMVLNPSMSSKLIEKLRNLQYSTSRNVERSKGDFVKTKLYKILSDVTGWSARFLQYINNVNSVKDTYYKKLCTEEKTFFGIRNTERRKRFEKYDNAFRKIMKKPHEVITSWGDKLAKNTVRRTYKIASTKMDNLDKLISEYIEKLPADKRTEINEKLLKIKAGRERFSAQNLDERLLKQEKLMSNLNNDIRNRWISYTQGFRNKFVKNSDHFNRNLSFWAHDMMEADKKIISDEGAQRVDYLFGNKNGVKGEYREVLDIISENLSPEEKNALEKRLKKAEKYLRVANKTECDRYFDKKRDLVLGSAPTDILSAVLSLSLCGITYVSADDRDKRISRLITGIIPAIAGFGTAIALTTMLFSGTKGLFCGIGASGVLSLIGSIIDKARLAAKNKLPEDD